MEGKEGGGRTGGDRGDSHFQILTSAHVIDATRRPSQAIDMVLLLQERCI